MHISPVANVITAHSLRYHQYAEDTPHGLSIKWGLSEDKTFKSLSTCVEDVARWFLQNGLLLNPAKTEGVLFCSKVQRDKIMTASGTDAAGTIVPFRNNTNVLGVTHGLVSWQWTVTSLQLSHTWTATLTNTAFTRLRQDDSPLPSCLHYTNALLRRHIDKQLLYRLQVAQNSLSSMVCQAPCFANATELRQQLHWLLPVRQRITYKLAVITYKTRSTGTHCSLTISPNPWLSTSTRITIIRQIVTFTTADGTSVVAKVIGL